MGGLRRLVLTANVEGLAVRRRDARRASRRGRQRSVIYVHLRNLRINPPPQMAQMYVDGEPITIPRCT
jgi:hypothetical protein